MTHDSDIELLAPAGSFETALAAFAAGANAVYLGLASFSARAEAVNFTPDELRDLIAYARAATPRRAVYVTFNTVLDDAQLPAAIETLALLDELRPNALIVQDLGVARLVKRHFPHLALHASTQLVAHNLEGVLALKELGFTRVVLARELPLEDIRSIALRSGVEIEVFVHGALCYSLSGLCLFSAMEKDRSGNRGKCAYCCRLAYTDALGARALPFSMRDLRLDDSLAALRDAGVASLKIEGRMKSALYVSTVTSHYRELLDGRPSTTTRADLETVFSRRTTQLYFAGYPKSATHQSPTNVIDPSSLGHLGTPIGTVKRLTKDREGRTWLRLHTSRALERHDGLQFLAEGGKPFGFGITDLRVALSRTTVFSVRAGSDVEILVPSVRPGDRAAVDPLTHIVPGATVFCSASNEVKRRFPVPSFRPSDYEAGTPIDLTVTLAPSGISLVARVPDLALEATHSVPLALTPSQHPERTEEAVRRAFARLGGTNWSLGAFTLVDPGHLFAPASMLNDARRLLVEKLDAARLAARAATVRDALLDIRSAAPAPSTAAREDALLRVRDLPPPPARVLKLRLDQALPEDATSYDELVIALGHRSGKDAEAALLARASALRAQAEAAGDAAPALRLALPVFTREREFNALRTTVKHLVKAGLTAWEAADLATLRLLRTLGLDDLTADWTLYGFNSAARATLAELGVKRVVLSPENSFENLTAAAAEHTPLPAPEFLDRQSTPLFLSLTRPATDAPSHLTGLKGDEFTSFAIDDLWVTTRLAPRTFPVPETAQTIRTDLSWNAAPIPS